MIVGRSSFEQVLGELAARKVLSLDTETTGLRPYHGDRLFCIILGTSPNQAYYFNFQSYEGLDPDKLLTPRHLARLQDVLFRDADRLWYITGAKYDAAILAADGIDLKGGWHCTVAQGRVEYSHQMKFDMDSQLKRFGYEPKLDIAKKWCEDNKAFTEITVEGRKSSKKNYHYDRVPFELITKYALYDACATYAIAECQIKSIDEQSQGVEISPEAVMHNERKLTRTVYEMEREGVLIDLPFTARAAAFEQGRNREYKAKFKELTGLEFSDSWQKLAKVFEEVKHLWEYNEPTKTGQVNPSFDGDTLLKFNHPVAELVMGIRDSKAKADFYTGFQYHADKCGRVHPKFNQQGAEHGRFSSSDPNFQNLSNQEDTVGTEEFIIRRAIVPPPGHLILAVDYSTMEYRFMLEYACAFAGRLTALAKRILAGEDFHQATADLATAVLGRTITRGQAKTSNFLTLYGGGDQKLADQLKITLEEAKAIRNAIRQAAPEINLLQRAMMDTAATRGYTRNWLGRRCYFPDRNFSYKAPNYLIAGGCADVVKVAMNQISDLLSKYESKMVMQVHDEIVFYIRIGEEFLIPQIKAIMESAYPSKYIPLTCSAYTSTKSLADLEDWNNAA